MKRTIARGQITFSDQILIEEKSEILSAWYAINGTNLAEPVGEMGSYYITKQLASKYGVRASGAKYTFNNLVYTFHDNNTGQVVFVYPGIGTAQLDTTYIDLREFLRSSGLFDEGEAFKEVFDWTAYSALLAAYYAAERTVQESVDDLWGKGIDKNKDAICELQSWANDDIISPVEKKSLEQMYLNEQADYARLRADAMRYLNLLPLPSTVRSDLSDALDDFEDAWPGARNAFIALTADAEVSSPASVEDEYDYYDILVYFTQKNNLLPTITAATDFITSTKAKESDYDYLKRALPKDTTTQVENAMVLSTLLGVKDGNNVVAGMAGGLLNFPMLWAAARSIQDVNEALWRVYGNGEQILGVHNGKRIRIFPDAGSASPDPRIEIYDGVDNTAPSSVFSGRTYNSIADVFGNPATTTLSSQTGSIVETNVYVEDPTHGTGLVDRGGGEYYEELQYATFTTNKAGKVTIGGTVTISGSFYSDDMCRLSMCRAEMYLDGILFGSVFIGDDSEDSSWNNSATYSMGTFYLPAGIHRLVLRLSFTMPDNAGPLIGVDAYISHSSNIVSIEYDSKRNELFGNGLAIGQTNQQYLWIANEGSFFRFKSVSGNAGIQLYNGQLKLKLGGNWYLCGVSGSGSNMTLKLTSTTE